MNFYVLTLFPELIDTIVNTSITGRAIKKDAISVNCINIRDFSTNSTRRVDDYPYGGGAGMVMEAEPVYRAIEAAQTKIQGDAVSSGEDTSRSSGETAGVSRQIVPAKGKRTRVVYLTPQAEVLNQTKVEELAGEENLILLCGHYEGIDDRVLDECVTDYISIGDYVLTGGELGAAVLIDAVSRFVPGVLSNEESSQFESMQDNLLEYPQYTRPETWHDRSVPEVLLSGDHKVIEEWHLQESLKRTEERRPDLLRNYFRTTGVYFGSENAEAACREIVGDITRYGTLLDYNRRKLQKTRKHFGRQELVVFVFDDKTDMTGDDLQEEGRTISGQMDQVFRNISGDQTPAVCIQAVQTASPARDDQITEADALINDEHSWNMDMLRAEMLLSRKGFRVLMTSAVSFENTEEIASKALDIRKKLLAI